MASEGHIQALKNRKKKIKNYADHKNRKGSEISIAYAITKLPGYKSWFLEKKNKCSEKFIVEVGNEMKYLFKNMREGFVMIRVNLFATIIAKFTGERIAAIFTINYIDFLHQKILIIAPGLKFLPGIFYRYSILALYAGLPAFPYCVTIW